MYLFHSRLLFPVMTTSALDILSRQTTSRAIATYQKWISPHKGFVCAHRVLHRGESCSQYIKRSILEHGLWNAIPLVQERFEDCKVANAILKAQRERQERLQRWRSQPIKQEDAQMDNSDLPALETALPGFVVGASATPDRKPGHENSCRRSDCTDVLDCADVFGDGAECLTDCASFDWNGFDCGNLDCSLSGCSSLDCGSMDCGSLDCGSCS